MRDQNGPGHRGHQDIGGRHRVFMRTLALHWPCTLRACLHDSILNQPNVPRPTEGKHDVRPSKTILPRPAGGGGVMVSIILCGVPSHTYIHTYCAKRRFFMLQQRESFSIILYLCSASFSAQARTLSLLELDSSQSRDFLSCRFLQWGPDDHLGNRASRSSTRLARS